MKKFAIILIVLSLLVLVFAEDNVKKSIGKISFPLGRSYVKPNGDTQWKPAKYNMAVYNKDVVKTKKESRCEIKFANKKVMRIGENTVVELKDNQSGNKEDVTISKGKAWISMFLPKGKSRLNVRTPSSVCGIRGTVYRLDCDDVKTQYRCYKGTIAVTPLNDDGTLSDKTIPVDAGEELILVMNFEEYMKQQKKLLKEEEDNLNKSMEQMEKEMQEAMNQDMQDFEKSKQEDAKAFSDFVKTGKLRIKKDKFDEKEEANSDWVQWNKERDAMISH
jgi:hypothetical protein